MSKIAVIIPAFNEALSIGQVIEALPKSIAEIIVVNNASTDQTAQVAEEHGAVVLDEKKMGMGTLVSKGSST